jgi:hypothetical protein
MAGAGEVDASAGKVHRIGVVATNGNQADRRQEQLKNVRAMKVLHLPDRAVGDLGSTDLDKPSWHFEACASSGSQPQGI